MMKRRKFCGFFSLGAIVSCFPMVLAACTSSEQVINETEESPERTSSKAPKRADGLVVVGTSSDLAQSGAISYKTDRGEPVIIVSDPDNNLYALSSLCSHRGCSVGWQTEKKNLYCACHGSEFNVEGKATQGPAREPLKQYEVKEENGFILFKA